MKHPILFLTLLLTSLPAFAKAPLLQCENGEGDLSVTIREKANGELEAALTMESTGGSYPTFRYAVEASTEGDSPAAYVGSHLSLKMSVGGEWRLRVDSPEINEKVECK